MKRPSNTRLPLRLLLATGVAAIALWTASPGPAVGQEVEERPVIVADELIHDRALDTLTARGNVEIVYRDSILRADTVNYQVTADRATASGSVVLVTPDGVTTFAEFAELTGDLAEGYAREVRLLLQDGSRMTAREATREAANRSTLTQGMYTACDACPDEPDRAPIWQVRATRVVHDQEAQTITHSHARLELWGVPVAYTPWLRHPDPTVRRRSGFLVPSIGFSDQIGGGGSATVTVPYFFVIDDHQDLTLTPTISTSGRGRMVAEHRFLGRRSSSSTTGSVVGGNAMDTRWHLDSDLRVHMTDVWRAGASLELASDETYRRTYGLPAPAYLTSRAYVEGFSQRSYATLRAVNFTDQSGTLRDLPLVAPLGEWSLVSAPGRLGQVHRLSASTAFLSRSKGTNSRRVSLEHAWHLPHVARTGEVWRLDTLLRGDLYDVDRMRRPGQPVYSGQTARFHPVAALTWSWPLERRGRTMQEIIEPIVQGVIAPRGQNPVGIPNEDSLEFDFNDSNLFALNRFPGHDRVEEGARVNYGLRWAAYGTRLGSVVAFVGQSWRANPGTEFGPNSGLEDHLSDYVGRVVIEPAGQFRLWTRFRIDKTTLQARRTEVGGSIGPPTLNISGTYTQAAAQVTHTHAVPEVRELSLSGSSALSRYWSLAGGMTYSHASATRGFRTISGALTYEDECTTLSLTGTRNFTSDRAFKGGLNIMLTVTLKTLGDIGYSVSPSTSGQ